MADTLSIGVLKQSTPQAPAPKEGPGRIGLFARSDRRVRIKRGGNVTEEFLASTGLLVVTGTAVTLTSKDDGVTVVANNAAATVTITLPDAASNPGFRVRVITKALPGAGAGTTITPQAIDKFQGNGFNAKTDGQTLIGSAATDAIGDAIELVSEGIDGWFILNKIGTWA